MEDINGTIHFSKTEQRDARLPARVARSDAHDKLLSVNGWKTDCTTQIQELSTADTYNVHPLHLANGLTKLLQRFHRLEVLSRDLGSLVEQDLGAIAATEIIDESLAGIPGIALDYLYQK